MITNIIVKLINGTDLKFSEVKDVIDLMTEGKVSDIQMAAFLTALRIKGETVEEITAAAQTIITRRRTSTAIIYKYYGAKIQTSNH